MTGNEPRPVESLFDVPEDCVLVGDEIRDPDNWTRCTHCGADCPADAETCFNCGEPLVE